MRFSSSAMSDTTLTRRVIVNNPQGLHMRPGEMFVRLASQFEAKIEVINDTLRVDGKSLLEVFTLGAVQGTELDIEASGPDAEEALDALAEFVQRESVDEDTTDQS